MVDVDTRIISQWTDRIKELEEQNANLLGALNWIINTIPVPEIELARSAWGNTNTLCVLEARAKAVSLLAHTKDNG